MQEKTTNLTASMQGTLYEANFKNRHPCGTLRKSIPEWKHVCGTLRKSIPEWKRVCGTLRKSIPEWKHVCGTLRKSIPSGNTFAEHSASQFRVETHLRNIPLTSLKMKIY